MVKNNLSLGENLNLDFNFRGYIAQNTRKGDSRESKHNS